MMFFKVELVMVSTIKIKNAHIQYFTYSSVCLLFFYLMFSLLLFNLYLVTIFY